MSTLYSRLITVISYSLMFILLMFMLFKKKIVNSIGQLLTGKLQRTQIANFKIIKLQFLMIIRYSVKNF